ncbi:MAG: Lrp/AsnC family transcriptional regulator [Candidatus Omnitrophica bacterium]|nr:Lrp/AsnC family transcriptional regulator [Candidatus Omnitrophota bacterium]
MEEILEILSKDARTTPAEIAKMVGKSESAVKTAIRKFEKNGTIVRYKTVIDSTKVKEAKNKVRALIEVSVSPQKNVGFDNVAERIYSFPEVTSCYLLSGAYDLLVIVEGEDLQTVSNFVAAKLSSMEAVRSTTTHFLLKKYKEDGYILEKKSKVKRLNISY